MERTTVSPAHRKLTVDDYELFPDDGQRHELIDGEHVVTAAPNVRHQDILAELFVAVREVVRAGQLGQVYFAPVDVVMSRHDVVQPDLLFVSLERRGIITTRLEAAPDLAVEVLLPSSRRIDELRKRARYERFGVRELWIVDPDIDGVRVYCRAAPEEPFARAVQLLAEAGDVLETPLLPGLRIVLAELFAADAPSASLDS